MNRYANNVGAGLISGNSLGTLEVRIQFDDDDLVEDLELISFGNPELDKIGHLAKNLLLYESILGANELVLEDLVIDGSYNSSILVYEAIGAAITDYLRKKYIDNLDDKSVD